MAEHTGSLRVVVHPDGWTIQGCEYSAIGVCIARQYGGSDLANARRIVALWNACIDLPTEVLEHAAAAGEDEASGRLRRLRMIVNTRGYKLEELY